MHDVDRSLKTTLKQWIPHKLGGGYRYFTGSLSFVLHRVTGLGLLAFLFFHVLSITKATNEFWKYDLLMHRYQVPDFKLGELALYAALLFHGINGLRILLIDFVFDSTHSAKRLFWACFALIAVLFIIGAIPLILHWNTQAFQAGVNGG